MKIKGCGATKRAKLGKDEFSLTCGAPFRDAVLLCPKCQAIVSGCGAAISSPARPDERRRCGETEGMELFLCEDCSDKLDKDLN